MNDVERNKRYQKLTLFFNDVLRDLIKTKAFKSQKKFIKTVEDIYGNRKLLLTAGRRSGKTFSLAIIALWYALFVSKIRNEPERILIVAGSQNQSKEMSRYINQIVNHYKWMRDRIGKDSTQKLKWSQTKITFKDGSSIEALPTSIRGITGKGCSLLIVDEGAVPTKTGQVIITKEFMEEIVEPLTWNPFSRIIMASSPYVYNSYFVSCYLDKSKGYKTFRWSLEERKDIPKHVFEDAKKRGDAYYKIYIQGIPARISRGMLTSIFLKQLARTEQEIAKLVKGIPSCRIGGLDYASKGESALVIMDYSKIDKEVPWKEIFEKTFREIDSKKLNLEIAYLLKKYNVSKVYVDANFPSHIHDLKQVWKGEVFAIGFSHGKGQQMFWNLRDIVLGKKILFLETKVTAGRSYNPTDFLIGQLIGFEFRKDIKKRDDLVDACALALSHEATFFYDSPEIRSQETKKEFKIWEEFMKSRGDIHILPEVLEEFTKEEQEDLPKNLKGNPEELIYYEDPTLGFMRAMKRKEAWGIWRNYLGSTRKKKRIQVY